MSEIILSSAVRSNLLSLQNTAQLLGKTQERLATGLKVNSALDDPSAFFTASALNSRASDLNRLLDSVGLAVQTLEAADAGISAITKLVESAQASARQALQDGSTTGQVEGTTVVAGTDTMNSLNLDDTDIISFTVGTAAAVNFTVGTDGSTVQDLVDFVNTSVADARAEIDSDGNLNVETTTGDNLTLGFTDTATTNTDGLEALGLATGTSVTSVAATGSFNTTRETLATEFDAIRDQIDQLAEDARFNGNNLLQSDDLTVIFNEDGTSSLTISGVDFDSARAWASAAAANRFVPGPMHSIDLTPLADHRWTRRSQPLRTQASTFGSNLSVVESPPGLHQGADQRAGNRCRRPDPGRYQRGRCQPAVPADQAAALHRTSLSLATQAEQNVLRLF